MSCTPTNREEITKRCFSSSCDSMLSYDWYLPHDIANEEYDGNREANPEDYHLYHD
jgi:hypothetical protein